jgi:AcrR family transcriptional regulator
MAGDKKASTPRRDVRLTEAGIYAAALTLIDTEGVEALSMRKLAAALGVNPMSLYHHVENKAALLAGVTRLVVTDVQSLTPSGGTWRDQLRHLARDFRSFAQAHPRLMEYAFTSPGLIQRHGILWLALCRILTEAGLPAEDVEPVGAVLASLVGGLLLSEVNGALRRLVDPATEDVDAATARSFDIAVDILIAGLEPRLGLRR